MGIFRAVLTLKDVTLKLVASRQNQILLNEAKDGGGKMHLIPLEYWPQTRHKHTPSQYEHHQRAVSTHSLHTKGECYFWHKFI